MNDGECFPIYVLILGIVIDVLFYGFNNILCYIFSHFPTQIGYLKPYIKKEG